MEKIKRRFGAIPSVPDKRDYLFRSIAGALTPVVPYHSDVKDIIIDQGESSQCGACAAIAARYETEYLQNGNTKNLSHTYVYGSDTDYGGEGMQSRTVMRIMREGIPYEQPWECWGDKTECFSAVKEHITPEIEAEAHMLRGSRYYSCKTWEEVCNAARTTNGAVIIMVRVYTNWFTCGYKGIIGRNSGDYYGNHFLRVKDYEILEDGVLKIRCQNSWGAHYGDKGYCYLRSDVNEFVEAFALVDDINEVTNRLLFPDVACDRWSATAIEECQKRGILTGFEDGTFRPDEPVTRDQLASVVYRMLMFMDGGGNDDG